MIGKETPQEGARRLSKHKLDEGFVPAGLYRITDNHYKIRLEKGDDKFIRPMQLINGVWEWGKPKFKNGDPLYIRAPENSKSDVIYVVEGEACVDALYRLSLNAATSGSATSAGAADWSPLKNKNVIIWPDCDDSGLKYAEDVVEALIDLALSIKQVDVKKLGLNEKDDCIEWLMANPNATSEAILSLPSVDVSFDKKNEPVEQPNSVSEIVEKSGVGKLDESSTPENVIEAIKKAMVMATGLDIIGIGILKSEISKKLKAAGVQGGAAIIRNAFASDKNLDDGGKQDQGLLFEDIKLHGDTVDGAKLADEIEKILYRHLVLPEGAAAAIALWIFHGWCFESFSISPLLVLRSPTKRCGKSTVATLVYYLSNRPLPASNITPAALFRAIEMFRPTLILDEADTYLIGNNELNGVINSGHTRSMAFVIRCDGDDNEPIKFNTFGPKVVAFIGKQKDTLMDRSVQIVLKRKMPGEKTEKIRQDKLSETLRPIRGKLARWSKDNEETLAGADPGTPERLNDRARDNWRPLLAVADQLGGVWPDKARKSALALSSEEDDDDSVKIMLLEDLRLCFKELGNNLLMSDEFVKFLLEIENRPWSEFGKTEKPITANKIARILKEFKVSPNQVRLDGRKVRGYELNDQLRDVFTRYLPDRGTQCEASGTGLNNKELGDFQSGTKSESVPVANSYNGNKNNGVPLASHWDKGTRSKKENMDIFDIPLQ